MEIVFALTLKVSSWIFPAVANKAWLLLILIYKKSKGPDASGHFCEIGVRKFMEKSWEMLLPGLFPKRVQQMNKWRILVLSWWDKVLYE
jgi:hypothetical protein